MKIWSLQALRFWAALSVVLYHAYATTLRLSGHLGVLGANGALFGRAGVDIFFVLSGVIITVTSQGLSAEEFAARRARRILPLYWMLSALYLIVGAVGGTGSWRETITSVTLWPALDWMTQPTLPVAWTLCFEMLFYAATTLVIWKPRLIWPILAAFAMAMAVRSDPVTHFIGNPIILDFLMGVVLARLPRWRGAKWLIPVGVLAIGIFGPIGYPSFLDVPDFLDGNMAWRRVLFMGLPAAMIVWGTLQIDARKGLLTYLGDASYALYLTHLPVVVTVAWVLCKFTSTPPDVIALAAAAASIALAWRVHELFEKPVLSWLRKPQAVIALPEEPAASA